MLQLATRNASIAFITSFYAGYIACLNLLALDRQFSWTLEVLKEQSV